MQLKNKFAEYLKSQNLSRFTIKGYVHDTEEFFDFRKRKYENVIRKDIIAWVEELTGKGLSPQSVNRKLASLTSYYKFLIDTERMQVNPVAAVRRPKKLESKNAYLSLSDLKKLSDFDIPVGHPAYNTLRRGKMAFELLFDIGVRISELIGIKPSDIDQREHTVTVLGKGRKYRTLIISGPVYDSLLRYIKEYDIEEDSPIFNHTPDWVNTCLKRLAKEAGLDKRVYAHIFRHSFATHVRRGGLEISELADALGHSSTVTTQIYAKNDMQKVFANINKAHPNRK